MNLFISTVVLALVFLIVAFGKERAAQDKKTLRDEFAMAALTGILAYPGCDYYGSAHNNGSPESVSRHAYDYADSMLKEREK